MRTLRSGTGLLLCLLILSGLSATAYAGKETQVEATGILDVQELTARIESILSERNVVRERIAIGFYYSGSGDRYFYNGDNWTFSASLFKVPLYMALDDEITEGRIRETDTDYTISMVDENRDPVLINSVTGAANWLMGHFGGREESFGQFRRYSELPDSYFPAIYAKNCDFTPRFMVDVMAWLLEHSDSYPKTLDSLYRSPLRDDLASLGERYDIAQKYGDFTEGVIHVHHMAAIIDTPTPIVVVVMTDWMYRYRPIMNAIATMFADYSLELDQQLAADSSDAIALG